MAICRQVCEKRKLKCSFCNMRYAICGLKTLDVFIEKKEVVDLRCDQKLNESQNSSFISRRSTCNTRISLKNCSENGLFKKFFT